MLTRSRVGEDLVEALGEGLVRGREEVPVDIHGDGD
jgi:hypothetical protein